MGKSNVIILDHPYTLASAENEPHNRSFSAALQLGAVIGFEEYPIN